MRDRNDLPRSPDLSATEMLLQAHEKRGTAARVREQSRGMPEEGRAFVEGRATKLDEEAAELEQRAERLMGNLG
jgi:hypothetical protein